MCLSERNCPGGHFEACAENMDGIACGRCLDGYYRTPSGCHMCHGLTTSTFLVPIMAIVGGPLLCRLLYRLSQDPVHKWGSPTNSISAGMFVTLNYLQVIATIQTCRLLYPSTI